MSLIFWLREGRVRHIGFSTHATTDLILEAVTSGEFDYVNLHWYFVNELNWPAVEAASTRDMGVFIISPNDKGGKLYQAPAKLRQLCAPLTPMQFNVLFCLARPQVHTLSCGVQRPGDFDEHVRALDHFPTAAETIHPIEERLRSEMVRVLGADWCARWPEGLPQYVDVPGLSSLQIDRGLTVTAVVKLEDASARLHALVSRLPAHELVVLGVRPDPKPHQVLFCLDGQRSVIDLRVPTETDRLS